MNTSKVSILEEFREDLKKYQSVAEAHADEQLSRLRSKAERHIRNVERRLDNLESDSEEFEESITEDSNVMDKYSQRIYERVQETLDSIERSEKVTLRNLNQYVESIRNSLAEQDKLLVKYVKLLKDRKYKGRVKSLDRALKSLISDLKSLENFIKKDYAPSAGVEEASDLINESLELIDTYKEQYDALLEHEEEVKKKYEEIEEIQEKYDALKHHPKKEAYEEAREEYETVQREIDYAFSHIRKVFRKYEKYVSKNNLDTDTALLSEMVTDAASAMAHQPSISSVESLLKEIEEALEDTALNLSRDKRETAKEDISNFLSGELEKHYQKATEVVKRKERLEKELESLDLDSKMATVKRDLKAAQRDASRIYRRKLRALSRTVEGLEKNVEDLKNQLRNITNDPVDIEVKLPDLPDWIESEE